MPQSTELQSELKTHELCACSNLRKAARAVTQFFDVHLAPSGLRSTQLGILATLHHLGPRNLSELADSLVMDRTTLTRNLRPLQRRGLIELVSGDDRRTRRVALTPEGSTAMSEAYPLWCEAQREIAGRLGVDRWKDISASLDEIIALTQFDESSPSR